jgi:hypothetical protein
MENKIRKGNTLIATFLGFKYYPWNGDDQTNGVYEPGWKKLNVPIGSKYLCRDHNQLRYHIDWNWLMEAIDKIESMSILDNKDVCFIFKQDAPLQVSIELTNGYLWPPEFSCIHRDTKIETYWTAVIRFIEWYNKVNDKEGNKTRI